MLWIVAVQHFIVDHWLLASVPLQISQLMPSAVGIDEEVPAADIVVVLPSVDFVGVKVNTSVFTKMFKGSLQKKKPEIYWSFTNTGGGTPRPIYFRFFPEEKFIA